MGTRGPVPEYPAGGAHRVEQNAVLLVLLGVKHVVTFLAESNTHEAWLVGPVGFHSDSLPVQLPRLLRRATGRRKGQNS